ncbi:unnamed protein product, partial [Ectocarpus fasciculatus]
TFRPTDVVRKHPSVQQENNKTRLHDAGACTNRFDCMAGSIGRKQQHGAHTAPLHMSPHAYIQQHLSSPPLFLLTSCCTPGRHAGSTARRERHRRSPDQWQWHIRE